MHHTMLIIPFYNELILRRNWMDTIGTSVFNNASGRYAYYKSFGEGSVITKAIELGDCTFILT